MEKTIEKHLTITSVYRDVEKLGHEIYSQDKGTATFKFTVDKLTASKVLCLFYFKYTKRYITVEATISENTITVPFDSTLIIADEPVVGYVYFEKVEQSTDVYSFAFNVWVSAMDKAKKAPLVERATGRIVDVENVVTKQELDAIFEKIKEQGGTYDDSNIRAEISHISADVESLKTKTDNDTVYNDTEIKQRLEVLEHKPNVNTSELVTKQELESKGYLTEHQSLSNYATKQEIPQPYNDTELKERVQQLENKPAIDTSNFVTNDVLAGKGYLTEHQSLEGYAKKSEIPQPYNDADVKQRLSVVEQKGEGYATKEQIASIPKTSQKLSIAGNVVTLSDGGGSITLPTAAASPGQVSEYEIHGTGMPNGRVTAPVGTTYVDTAVTNGALKWIKMKGNDNRGWEVLIGDTGWRTLNISSKLGASYLKVRRQNNTVTYQFGGLSWGWFGIVRRGALGYNPQPSDRERNCYLIPVNGIPQGFRSEASLISNIYNDKGVIYGTWYLGGAGDGNQLRFQFIDPVPTDRDIGDIRVSQITYLTSEPWPDRLP